MSRELDHTRIDFLHKRFAGIVRAHLEGRVPHDRAKVLEVLNALAITLAYVFAGTGIEKSDWEFFTKALNDQTDQIEADVNAELQRVGKAS